MHACAQISKYKNTNVNIFVYTNVCVCIYTYTYGEEKRGKKSVVKCVHTHGMYTVDTMQYTSTHATDTHTHNRQTDTHTRTQQTHRHAHAPDRLTQTDTHTHNRHTDRHTHNRQTDTQINTKTHKVCGVRSGTTQTRGDQTTHSYFLRSSRILS